MSFHTQAKRMLNAGRSWLSPSEGKGTPWYGARAWQIHKEAIKRRVARAVENAHARSVIRQRYAKEHGMLPREVTNAMIGFVKVSNWISKRKLRLANS